MRWWWCFTDLRTVFGGGLRTPPPPTTLAASRCYHRPPRPPPCVPSLPRATPGYVLGRDRAGWAEVGRGRRRDVVVDSVRIVRRFVVVEEGSETRGGRNLDVAFSRERKKLFECGFHGRTAHRTSCAPVKTALKKLFPFPSKSYIQHVRTFYPLPVHRMTPYSQFS